MHAYTQFDCFVYVLIRIYLKLLNSLNFSGFGWSGKGFSIIRQILLRRSYYLSTVFRQCGNNQVYRRFYGFQWSWISAELQNGYALIVSF